MAKVAIAWLVAFAVSWLHAKYAPLQLASTLTMPFPHYDEAAIYRQVKGRPLGPVWLIATLVGASLVAVAMGLSNSSVIAMLLLLMPGVVVIVVAGYVRGYRLFRLALVELGLPWPPEGSRPS